MLKVEQTVQYKTHVKTTMVEAMAAVFANHPDTILRTKVAVSTALPTTEAEYPAVLVRFYERYLRNMGIGHHEWLPVMDDNGLSTGQVVRFKHYMYSGDVEFAIYALSSFDRDLVADAVVQVLTMGDMEAYSTPFYDRIYTGDYVAHPGAEDHFITLSSDTVSGYGESEMIAPWMPEDVLVYQTSYRIPIQGEFYSRTPDIGPVGLVSAVPLYPYAPVEGETPPDPEPTNPNPWFGDGDEFF